MTFIELQEDSQSRALAREITGQDQVAKRMLDLAICLFSLPVLLVLMAVIAVAIVLDTPGSPLFIQARVGKDGRRFRLYKFRTMRRDYDSQVDRAFMQAYIAGQSGTEDNSSGKALNKPAIQSHITRVGRVLRKSSLDELPQVFNVLRGDMSLVGPRPNVPWEVDAYRDWHFQRLKVLPGITGLAQVHGRSWISFDTIVRYDIEFIEQYSLWLDLRILWWTVTSVVGGRGAG